MKQNAQQILTRLLTVIMAGVAGIGFATAATAATAAGVGVGAGTNVGAGAQAGGNADTHMNATASANSNAQWQSGATRDADRAAERMGTNSGGQAQSAAADLEAAKTTRPDPR